MSEMVFVPASDTAYVTGTADAGKILDAQLKDYFESVSAADRAKSAETHLRVIRKYAPEWETEFEKISLALGWEPYDFAAKFSLSEINCGCTSWILPPWYTDSGKMILHKNRDNKRAVISCSFQQTPGRFKWFRCASRFVHGGTQLMNERGLALVMNAGDTPLTEPPPREHLHSTAMARIVVEQCSSAASGAEMIRRIVAEGNDMKGQIFLLADPHEAYVVECSPRHYASARLEFGFSVYANSWKLPGMESISRKSLEEAVKDRAREMIVRGEFQRLHDSGSDITLADVFRVSRFGERKHESFGMLDAPFNRWTLCAVSLVPDNEFPELLSTAYVALGPPRHTIYLPIPMGADSIPLPILNGDWAENAFRFREDAGDEHGKEATIESLEEKLLAEFADTLASTRKLLRAGKRTEAGEYLNTQFRKQVSTVHEALPGLRIP